MENKNTNQDQGSLSQILELLKKLDVNAMEQLLQQTQNNITQKDKEISKEQKQLAENLDKPEVQDLIKGMREISYKKIVTNLESTKKNWNDLNVPKEIQDVLFDMKMLKPSIIQAVAIPNLMNEASTNFVFQAINGSGKTLSFGIPSIMKVNPDIEFIQIVILANTRELIRQIQQVIEKVSRNTNVKSCIGDQSSPQQIKSHILVTVPGWLSNKLNGKKPMDLSHVQLIVFDEADELFLHEQNQKSIATIYEHFKKLSISPQNVLFSATYTEYVKDCINHFLPSYKPFFIAAERLKLQGVKMFRIQVDNQEKKKLILDFYLEMDQTQAMIFVNKKDEGEKLQQYLKKNNIDAKILTSDLEQIERDKLIDQFRKTEFTTLICTNILARGIDVPEVDLVINYDVPFISNYGFKNPDYANYMHRVGRTGRFGTDGLALTLTSKTDEVYDDLLNQIEKYYQIQIQSLNNLNELIKVYEQMRPKQ